MIPKETKLPVKKATLEPDMRSRILTAFEVWGKGRSIKWWELTHLVGPKALGDFQIQLDELGTRDHNIKVWYGVSKEFQDAIQKLRDDKVIRLFQASPVGYFSSAQLVTVTPLPITPDYRIGHTKPHLFLTHLELVG